MTEDKKSPEVRVFDVGYDSPTTRSPRAMSVNPTTKVSFLASLRRFPRNGAIGLAGSAFTVVLSWLTLFLFSQHEVASVHMLKPPAWTSIITSMNSYFIQMAVQQGISISWWRKAESEKITVAELHDNWLLGSGIVSALSSKKKFNFVALAVIFVFTVPLNGLILANAVSLVLVQRQSSTSGNTKFLMAPSLPFGYSGLLDSDGGIEGYTSLWQNAIPSIFSSNSRAVFLSPIAGDKYTNCEGTCNATLQGVGFSSSCEQSKVPYNLPTDNNPQNIDYSSPILQIALTWNAENPNIINLMTTNKRHSSCIGDLDVTTCKLQMAKVSYAVNVQKNITGHGNYWWSFYTSATTSALSTYQPLPIIEYYGMHPDEGKTNSTFGGIAQVLGAYYNTSTVFQSTSNSTSLDLTGIYAQQVPPNYQSQGPDYNKCNTSYSLFTTPIPATAGVYYKNVTDAILVSLQHIFFFTSISAASSLSSLSPSALPASYVQTSTTNNDITTHEVYQINWIYWCGSVVITLSIITFILPTYYGFWMFEEKKSMAPLAMSKVFAEVERRSRDRDRDGDCDGGRERGGGRDGSGGSGNGSSGGGREGGRRGEEDIGRGRGMNEWPLPSLPRVSEYTQTGTGSRWSEMQKPRRTRFTGDGNGYERGEENANYI